VWDTRTWETRDHGGNCPRTTTRLVHHSVRNKTEGVDVSVLRLVVSVGAAGPLVRHVWGWNEWSDDCWLSARGGGE
jgi:hypothetical protein